jgi:hypothetical protein
VPAAVVGALGVAVDAHELADGALDLAVFMLFEADPCPQPANGGGDIVISATLIEERRVGQLNDLFPMLGRDSGREQLGANVTLHHVTLVYSAVNHALCDPFQVGPALGRLDLH